MGLEVFQEPESCYSKAAGPHNTAWGETQSWVIEKSICPVHSCHSGSTGTYQVITCGRDPPGGMGILLHSEVTYLRKVVLDNVQSSLGNLMVLMKLQSLDSIYPTKFFDQKTQVLLLQKLLCCLGVAGWQGVRLGESLRWCSSTSGIGPGLMSQNRQSNLTFPKTI